MAFVLTLMYVAISLLSPGVLPEGMWSLHVNIILGIAAILALIPQLGQAKLNAIPDPVFVLGLIFASALSMVPVGFSTVPDAVMAYIPIFITFYFVFITCQNLGHLRIMSWVLVAVGLFIFFQGWMAEHAQDFASPYLLRETRGGELIYRHQGLGVLSDPNDTAQFFVTLIPLTFLRWKKGSFVSNLLFTIAPVVLLSAAVYYTHSRGGAFALVAVCLFGFKNKLGFVLSSVLAVGLFAGMMAINISGGRGMEDDDGSRVAFWSTGLEIFKAHPVVGVGIGRFPEYNGGLTAHNSYVVCLAEVGMIGYFCWMGTIVLNLTGLSQISKSKNGEKSEADEQNLALPPHLRWRPALERSTVVPAVMPLQATPAGSPGFASVAYTPAVSPSWAPPSVRFGKEPTNSAASDADLIHFAKVLGVAFVGLLSAGYFISRAFSMIFYVLLGMSAAVRVMYLERHPELKPDRKTALKRVFMVMIGSIVFLYLFVRIRGIH